MAKRNTKSLSSFFNSNEYTEDLLHLEDILDMPVEIKGYNIRRGQNGEFAVITLTILETGSEVKVTTGAMAAMDMLKAAETARAFPFACKFTKRGRMYIPVELE